MNAPLASPQQVNHAATVAPPVPRWSWLAWGIWCLALAALYFFIYLEEKETFAAFLQSNDLFKVIAVSPLLATIYYGGYFLIRRLFHLVRYRNATQTPEIASIVQKSEALQEDLDKDFFTNLVRINFKYLDKYYLQTQEQGDKSFALSAAAAVVGLMIIVAGIVMALLKQTDPAILTTSAGVLSEFIAAVFFYLYNRTILSMGQYHQKLVITQNIALALKITGDLPKEDRVKSQLVLVEALTRDVNHLLSGQLALPASAAAKA